jgi:hypothetical protein
MGHRQVEGREDMNKFICTMSIGSSIHYATVVAETQEQAREMAVAETNKNKKPPAYEGRPRSWSVRVLEADVPGPAQVLDCGEREA